MSGDKATSPCNKFQANIFNKSKCQNCFKSRELHLLADHDMEQAKPVYGGWLCLAPEGTDFNNPIQRSRKWQRRFFILYEHGSLSFALDELPSTLPQGTVNLNLCTEVIDAEPRTGQRNSLCIITPEQEICIRGENKEIINGWNEHLAAYPRANKQNQTKKRKVEPVATQEPSPAKMAATDPCFPTAESPAEPGSSPWQEDQLERRPNITPVWTVTDTDPPGPQPTPAGNMSRYLCPVSRESLASDGSWLSGTLSGSVSSLDSAASGGSDPGDGNRPAEPEPNGVHTSADNKDQREDGSPPETLTGSELAHSRDADEEPAWDPVISRKGRSEARTSKREKLQSCGDLAQLSAPPPQRRSKSLDRRTSESVMTPDLLNFKKGWMVKLDEEDQWKKYWFVLSTDSLRYYKDSMAEEASDLEGEIDLTECYNVSEYQVQRNYGFQIHTRKGFYTLSAMTAGIRRNWIQALMKNVHPTNAPDVASLTGHHIPCKPDVTQDSSPAEASAETDKHSKPRTVTERRREGRYKTFDWAEFRPLAKPAPDLDARTLTGPCSFELGDPERKKRREERRRRYESMLGFPLALEAIGDHNAADGGTRASSPRSQQKMEEEIEQCWQQVERTVFRLERTVPLHTDARDAVEMETLLDGYRKGVEDLKAQLAQSDHRRLELEAQLRTAGYHQQHVCPLLDPPLCSESDFGQLGANEKPVNSHTQSLNEMYRETRELLQQQNMIRQSMQEQLSIALSSSAPQHPQPPSILLHDTEGNLQELGGLLRDPPVTENTSLLSPASDKQHSVLHTEGETRGTNLDRSTPDHQNRLNSEVHQQVSSSETQINGGEWSASSLIMEETGERDDDRLSCCDSLSCVDKRTVSDQTIVKRLSQDMELLTSQNEALNQRNQEMLNQLTEADREIGRLKAELTGRHSEPYHISEVEQLSETRVEDLERELSVRNQQLLEAQSLIASLERRLKDSEMVSRQRDATLPGLETPADTEEAGEEKTDRLHGDKKAEGYFLRCFEATEAKLKELERQLCQSELTCRELQAHNTQLREAERLCSQRAAEAEADIKRLNQELKKERMKEGKELPGRDVSVSGEERIQQVVNGMVMRLEALGKLLEVIDRLDLGMIKKSIENEHEEERPALVSHLTWQEEAWGALLNELKVSPSQPSEDKHVEGLLSRVAEQMVVEEQMLLLVHGLLSETDSCTDNGKEGLEGTCEGKRLTELDIIGNIASLPVSEREEKDDSNGICHLNGQHCDTDTGIEGHFAESKDRISLLNHLASSAGDKLQLMADRLCDFHISEHPWSGFIHSVATEALYRCHLSKLHSAYQREHLEVKQKLLSSSLVCGNCAGLMSENEELRARLSNLEKQMIPSSGAEMPTLSRTEHTSLQDTDHELQVADAADVSTADEMEEQNLKLESAAEDLKLKTQEETVEEDSSTRPRINGVENPASRWVGGQEKISDENSETADASREETDPRLEAEEVVSLRRRVKDLEEQLSCLAARMKEEFDGEMSSVQLQHEKDMEKLKATYESGFTAMEESHQRLLDELQRRHHKEVERLLEDRDRRLEEETAATAIAIEAIKNAHRLELEREVQRRCQSKSAIGSTDLEEIWRQHREELASCERELEVLSQQYSLKCLENGHLAQALDAERKALCQCQQENQDLRTRNQELSSHLAAEITRLCSLAKQDAPPLSQGMDVYEMEITLRVKESEVQCLKQEIASLKDELQSAQRDKRSAAKKYKDIYTELSIVRAKSERDLEQLRENLRLARQALGQTSPPHI
ncbi:myosin phosphatase Rho-interacting protein-like [Myripristis murdjan]|uniref:myosin phosphatase Rho-interacting protein-like n=1 Tax=Myripristis murdjan TaxID=586833 RepID=UPI001175FF0C|nr:myosin phosphatase Rho-interacting protein-like [Myripristis murdjan]